MNSEAKWPISVIFTNQKALFHIERGPCAVFEVRGGRFSIYSPFTFEDFVLWGNMKTRAYALCFIGSMQHFRNFDFFSMTNLPPLRRFSAVADTLFNRYQ